MAVKKVKPKYEIKFSFCPIDKHKGELWEKLQDRDLDEPCEIIDIDLEYSDNILLGWWRKDTFDDFTKDDINQLIAKFNNGLTNVPGILLTFDHMDGEFTTFRTWSARKVQYYMMLQDDCEKLAIRTPLNPKSVA